jgi:molybdate transport repressor ModE-like protein
MADKNRTGLDWEDVRIFVALARHGSLSAAARALSVNHATISRRIQSLEAVLGEKLVERRPDGYVLTPAGTQALSSASDMEAAAAILRRGGIDDRPKGLVRINAPPSLVQSFLIERLARLSTQHPGLDIDVASDVRSVSLDRRETDIALRLGRPQDGDVIAKPLVNLGFGFYGTADALLRTDKGGVPVFIGFDEVNAHLPESAWLSRQFPRARLAFRTSNHVGQAIAAKSGAGIALLPHFVGRQEPRLRPCRLEHATPSRRLWLITRRLDRKDLSIRTVVDHLFAIFAAERELFED